MLRLSRDDDDSVVHSGSHFTSLRWPVSLTWLPNLGPLKIL
jgi:hypothetical protein